MNHKEAGIMKETIKSVIDNCLKLCDSALGERDYNFVKEIWNDDSFLKNSPCYAECHEYIAQLRFDYLSIRDIDALTKELDRISVRLHGITVYRIHTYDRNGSPVVIPSLCLTLTHDPHIPPEEDEDENDNNEH